MKTTFDLPIATVLLATFNLSAATLYASLESTNPVASYARRAGAATNMIGPAASTSGADPDAAGLAPLLPRVG